MQLSFKIDESQIKKMWFYYRKIQKRAPPSNLRNWYSTTNCELEINTKMKLQQSLLDKLCKNGRQQYSLF